MLCINFIGCGQLGRTLGHLWQKNRLLIIGDVLNQSLESAQSAVQQMNAGRAISRLEDMQSADLYLIGSSDDAIESCSETLARSGLINTNNIVFHCSGAKSSLLLNACRNKGASVASFHPIKVLPILKMTYIVFLEPIVA